MRLSGIELCNFRSIGAEPVILTPWKKCNILIGQNNSGKSNVIKAIQKVAYQYTIGRPGTPQLDTPGLTDLDLHRRSGENAFEFTFHFECSTPDDKEISSLAEATSFWFRFIWQKAQGGSDPTLIDHSAKLLSREGIWASHFAPCVPFVYLIPEFRQIREGDVYTLDGVDLIGLLARYQHPEDGKEHEREKFDRIEQFARQLLHLPDAVLEVTHDKAQIMLTSNDLRLPLSSYGTGVHELIILVTAVLSVENAICCIEEPEIHLHPRLQREFIEFIVTETSNEYLISTHSPTFINIRDTSDAVQVFHLRLQDGATVGGPVLTDEQSLLALHDLGVRASDILQANCVIWVEGPSDRIYIKRWIGLVEPSLIEGRDYSIMFYGGRLLSHLCVERDKVPNELIHILRINQNAMVVMDSDRDKPRQRLGMTKRRVRAECEQNGGICWVTDGREIENYLPESVVVATCEIETDRRITFSINQYDKFEEKLEEALSEAGAKRLNYAANKVKYARKFAQRFELDDMSPELRKRIEQVIAKINSWNS